MSQAHSRGDASLDVLDVLDDLTADERARLELLRRENARLRADTGRRRPRIRWRSVIAVVLIVVGCVVTPVSLVAVWTHNEVSDAVETARVAAGAVERRVQRATTCTALTPGPRRSSRSQARRSLASAVKLSW